MEQEGFDFDRRLLDFKINGIVYIDGYWQSENYFKDVEQTIRQDLQITPPDDPSNQNMTERIRQCNAVAVHMRWFDKPSGTATHKLSTDYYRCAIALMEEKFESSGYFLFSDDPEATSEMLDLPVDRIICMNHNCGNEYAYADLWIRIQTK